MSNSPVQLIVNVIEKKYTYQTGYLYVCGVCQISQLICMVLLSVFDFVGHTDQRGPYVYEGTEMVPWEYLSPQTTEIPENFEI